MSRYGDRFFAGIAPGSLRSAEVVEPLVRALVPVESVCDIGGGTGAWLVPFHRAGSRVVCIDGPWVDRRNLLVPQECFVAVDLERDLGAVTGSFDLVICLEIAEHLHRRRAPHLVELLARAAPAVLFSAALPGQGGTRHVNERPFAFWRRLFEAQGMIYLDPIRRHIWQDPQVEGWYQQNIRMFVQPALVEQCERVRQEVELACHEFPNLYSDYLLGSPRLVTRHLRMAKRELHVALRHRTRRVV